MYFIADLIISPCCVQDSLPIWP